MTWSPFFSDTMPGPTSTTTPAPSWPKTTGNSPSGSPPERVNSSVWQTPDALISTSTSPNFGPSRSTVSISSLSPALKQTAALVFTLAFPQLCIGGEPRTGPSPCHSSDVLHAGRQGVELFRAARCHQHAGANVDPDHAEAGVGFQFQTHTLEQDEIATADAGPCRSLDRRLARALQLLAIDGSEPRCAESERVQERCL